MEIVHEKYKRKFISPKMKERQLICLEVCMDYLEDPELYKDRSGTKIREIINGANTDMYCESISNEYALLIDFRYMKGDIGKQIPDLPTDLEGFILYAASYGYNAIILRDNEDAAYGIEQVYPTVSSYMKQAKADRKTPQKPRSCTYNPANYANSTGLPD